MSYNKWRKDICCYFLSLLSHKPWGLTSPISSRPGRVVDMFDIQLNLELLLLRKNSQRRHICFGIIEKWDQKRPFRSWAPHFLLLFNVTVLFCFFFFLSCTANSSLKFLHRWPFVKLFHSVTLLIKLLRVCRSLAHCYSRSSVSDAEPGCGYPIGPYSSSFLSTFLTVRIISLLQSWLHSYTQCLEFLFFIQVLQFCYLFLNSSYLTSHLSMMKSFSRLFLKHNSSPRHHS